DFNTTFTSMDRSSKQKINKETVSLDDTLDQMDITDIYRTFHLKLKEYTFFSSAHGTFSRIDHMLVYKISLNQFKKIEIIPPIFPIIMYETRNQLQEKNTNMWRLNNLMLSNQWVNEVIKEEI
ncbi:hypothetical protein PANDA_008337, partial [Ailuropoda melanoleuca]